MERQHLLSQGSQKALASASVIRRIFLLGQKLKEQDPNATIIDLSLGNPDLEPPEAVSKALQMLALERTPGSHRYMDNAGFFAVRASLAEHLSRETQVSVAPSSVYMTCGAAGGLHILMRTLLDPGDEVLLLAPYFVEYPTYLAVHGAKPVVVPLRQGIQPGIQPFAFVPSIEDILGHITPKTRMIILNSPNNPSGCVYPESFYRQLDATLAEREAQGLKAIHIVSDEPYAHLTFTNVTTPSVLANMRNSWLIRSHSKDLGLAGERIGFIAWQTDTSDEALLNAMRAAARALGFVNAPALMQRLLPLVLGARVATEIYEARAKVFCDILRNGGVSVESPGGTFFVLPQTPLGWSDSEFCDALAAQGVLVVPAAAFGAPGYFRASLTQPDASITQAAEVIVATANNRKNSPKPP